MNQKINQIKKVPLTQAWKLLVKSIIRPPRQTYNPQNLGTCRFMYEGRSFKREDYDVPYKDTIKINLSIFSTNYSENFLILYLHSNASNKLQAIQLLKYMPSNFSLACFDFIGCGNSNQENTISLGIKESQQTQKIIQFLRKEGYKIALWGRSMGAATALLCKNADMIVADSPFLSLRRLSQQAVQNYSPTIMKYFVGCFFSCIFYKLKLDVKKAADYDLDDLNIQKAVQRLDYFTPLILMSADQDQLINKEHSIKLYECFRGDIKHIQIFEGTHNSPRSKEVLTKIMQLVRQNMYRIGNAQSISRYNFQIQSTYSENLQSKKQ